MRVHLRAIVMSLAVWTEQHRVFGCAFFCLRIQHWRRLQTCPTEKQVISGHAKVTAAITVWESSAHLLLLARAAHTKCSRARPLWRPMLAAVPDILLHVVDLAWPARLPSCAVRAA
jgi:hypothetical protein